MNWSDTHFHIDVPAEAESILQRARTAGVRLFLLQGTNLQNSREAIELARRHEDLYAAVGGHPLNLEEFTSWEEFRPIYQNIDEVRAVGEIGLDYHYSPENAGRQQEILQGFLRLAKELDLPAILHCREAFADCHRIVSEILPAGFPLIVHSFTGTPEEAELWLKRGAYLSVNGMVTFKKAENIRTALQRIPLHRLLLETDSPYLAPVPLRGTTNEPANIPIIGKRTAEEKGISPEELAEITTANAKKLLRI